MKKFEKNYRSVELLMAVFMNPLYGLGIIDEELYDKTDKFMGWAIKHCPGFLSATHNKLFLFLAKYNGRFLFTFRMKSCYQKAMNYLYDNFTIDELKLIYDNYKKEEGGHQAAVDYIFNRI